ncbi:hypothetical protein BO71DRAFT_433591 [Aspergillus ellipticus CBS 707.79]|uniref:Uncharacterized protein n=1 Tax=Aspergillus ellipticus CBS 707.79 TaxID=1448320 RepID=A0A319EI99_9EURO|nr:hypothetical protein BO71DRAFT_433591 [Aspergillus ellipticus CBS 707.79]
MENVMDWARQEASIGAEETSICFFVYTLLGYSSELWYAADGSGATEAYVCAFIESWSWGWLRKLVSSELLANEAVVLEKGFWVLQGSNYRGIIHESTSWQLTAMLELDIYGSDMAKWGLVKRRAKQCTRPSGCVKSTVNKLPLCKLWEGLFANTEPELALSGDCGAGGQIKLQKVQPLLLTFIEPSLSDIRS